MLKTLFEGHQLNPIIWVKHNIWLKKGVNLSEMEKKINILIIKSRRSRTELNFRPFQTFFINKNSGNLCTNKKKRRKKNTEKMP